MAAPALVAAATAATSGSGDANGSECCSPATAASSKAGLWRRGTTSSCIAPSAAVTAADLHCRPIFLGLHAQMLFVTLHAFFRNTFGAVGE